MSGLPSNDIWFIDDYTLTQWIKYMGLHGVVKPIQHLRKKENIPQQLSSIIKYGYSVEILERVGLTMSGAERLCMGKNNFFCDSKGIFILSEEKLN